MEEPNCLQQHKYFEETISFMNNVCETLTHSITDEQYNKTLQQNQAEKSQEAPAMTKPLPRTIHYSLSAWEWQDKTWRCSDKWDVLQAHMACIWLDPHCSTSTNCWWLPFYQGRHTFLFGLRGTAKYMPIYRMNLVLLIGPRQHQLFSQRGKKSKWKV